MDIDLPVILAAAFVAAASPGPATLTIAGTSMGQGRREGLTVALGIVTGSLIWSVIAAFGFSAVMLAHAWALELTRYIGAAYLVFLALKSARSALSTKTITPSSAKGDRLTLYVKGLALHLTNPKAILFFGSLYAIGVPAGASLGQLLTVVVAIGIQCCVIFLGYALVFSTPGMAEVYTKLRRWFEGAFAVAFGAAGLKILTTRLQ